MMAHVIKAVVFIALFAVGMTASMDHQLLLSASVVLILVLEHITFRNGVAAGLHAISLLNTEDFEKFKSSVQELNIKKKP